LQFEENAFYSKLLQMCEYKNASRPVVCVVADKSLWIYALRKPAKGGFIISYAWGHTFKSVQLQFSIKSDISRTCINCFPQWLIGNTLHAFQNLSCECRGRPISFLAKSFIL